MKDITSEIKVSDIDTSKEESSVHKSSKQQDSKINKSKEELSEDKYEGKPILTSINDYNINITNSISPISCDAPSLILRRISISA